MFLQATAKRLEGVRRSECLFFSTTDPESEGLALATLALGFPDRAPAPGRRGELFPAHSRNAAL